MATYKLLCLCGCGRLTAIVEYQGDREPPHDHGIVATECVEAGRFDMSSTKPRSLPDKPFEKTEDIVAVEVDDDCAVYETKGHAVSMGPDGDGWIAKCSCGWFLEVPFGNEKVPGPKDKEEMVSLLRAKFLIHSNSDGKQ